MWISKEYMKRRNEKMTEKEEVCDRIHCKHNPNAQEPFEHMKGIELTDLTWKLLEKSSEELGMNPNCVMCKAARTLVKMPIEEVLKIVREAKFHE